MKTGIISLISKLDSYTMELLGMVDMALAFN